MSHPGNPSGLTIDPLHAEVRDRFGVLPNFFRLAPDTPEITANLWGFAKFGYLDNPLPSLFKERLFVYLSRFCEVRYCIARHVGFLVGLGRPSGDRHCPPETVEQVVRLIRRPLPRGDDLEPHLALLEAGRSPLPRLPESDTPAEEADLRLCHARLPPDAAGGPVPGGPAAGLRRGDVPAPPGLPRLRPHRPLLDEGASRTRVRGRHQASCSPRTRRWPSAC